MVVNRWMRAHRDQHSIAGHQRLDRDQYNDLVKHHLDEQARAKILSALQGAKSRFQQLGKRTATVDQLIRDAKTAAIDVDIKRRFVSLLRTLMDAPGVPDKVVQKLRAQIDRETRPAPGSVRLEAIRRVWFDYSRTRERLAKQGSTRVSSSWAVCLSHLSPAIDLTPCILRPPSPLALLLPGGEAQGGAPSTLL